MSSFFFFSKGHATHFETQLDETTAELTAAGVPTKQEDTESMLADTFDTAA